MFQLFQRTRAGRNHKSFTAMKQINFFYDPITLNYSKISKKHLFFPPIEQKGDRA
jgi:hypothetical protein